jgi:hypothetical protein
MFWKMFNAIFDCCCQACEATGEGIAVGRAGPHLRRWLHEKQGGYTFFCPGCGGPHTITTEGEAAWRFNGNLDRPTFTPSVLVTRGEWRCHSFVTDGQIQFLDDCTHSLKGQTVPLPVLPEGYRG